MKSKLNRYLVGGAVRDILLGRTPKDRDWVVVGHTEQDMLNLGFEQVGNDFPVFLHPETKEEHALARTERKTSAGYQGFEVQASPEVTLEEDLARRDLTINAMALTDHNIVIDPFDGQQDLQEGILRHVSEAFKEDPVRILRVARFSAQYHFDVASETMKLMKAMVEAGEVDSLMPERVMAELMKALDTMYPSRFIRVLRKCGALKVLFPEIDVLFGIPQPAEHHPEIDTGIHTLMVLDIVAQQTTDRPTRFAVLLHDLGKGITPPEKWPAHHGHEEAGVAVIEELCERLKAPKEYKILAQKVSEYHLKCHKAFELRPNTIVKLFQKLDAFRKPYVLRQFLSACKADSQGRKGFIDRAYPQADYLLKAFEAAAQVKAEDITDGSEGRLLGEAIYRKRIIAVKIVRTWYK